MAEFEKLTLKQHSLQGQIFDYGKREELLLPLLGTHQLKNAAVAITAADVLIEKGWKISGEQLREGLACVKWPGRFEVISNNPFFIIDGGHNPQCIDALVENMENYLSGRKIVAIAGVLADKDYEEMFRPIFPYIAEFVCITPPSPRSLKAEQLATHLEKANVMATAYASMEDAILYAVQSAGEEGTVLCFGSLYSIGEIQKTFEKLHLH